MGAVFRSVPFVSPFARLPVPPFNSGTARRPPGTVIRTNGPRCECLMDCREFRNKHVAFVDDLLPAFEMDAMQRHLLACSNCSRHDTKIRRSLLIVRNLPPIEPSPEFIV